MNDTPSAPAGYSFVLVPSEDLPAVHILLAERAARSQHSRYSEMAETSDAGLLWTDADLARLARGDKETTEIVGLILDFLAAHPGDWYSNAEMARAIGRPESQVTRIWSKLKLHTNASEHYTVTTIPVRDRSGRRLDPPRLGDEKDKVFYSLTFKQSEQWLRIRSTD